MDYILLKRVLNIIKLQLWHKSKRRICLRGYMVCCDKCNKAYMNEFDGYLCLRIFFKKKGYNSSRDVVPNLDSLTFSFDLDKFDYTNLFSPEFKFKIKDLKDIFIYIYKLFEIYNLLSLNNEYTSDVPECVKD